MLQTTKCSNSVRKLSTTSSAQVWMFKAKSNRLEAAKTQQWQISRRKVKWMRVRLTEVLSQQPPRQKRRQRKAVDTQTPARQSLKPIIRTRRTEIIRSWTWSQKSRKANKACRERIKTGTTIWYRTSHRLHSWHRVKVSSQKDRILVFVILNKVSSESP